MKKFTCATIFVASTLIPSGVDAATYKNCKALNSVYPHGIAKNSASAKKQKNMPKVSSSIYKAHLKMDRDKDGTVCEK